MNSAPADNASPLVKALFVSTCALSIVSWYTTYQGMVLYLSPWFAFLASLGIQSALVLVAWLTGMTRERKPLLITVYAITAVVSVAFSYVSLYTWFSAKERPAIVERQLYDTIHASAGKTGELLTGAIAEAEKHVLALEEMTAAEKAHGHIARAQDADPYLMRVRDAVGREAQTYSDKYQEGAGTGVRYTAFDRYSKMARQSLEQLRLAQKGLQEFRAQLKPQDASEQQIRQYRAAYDAVPWNEVEQHLHSANLQRPVIPAFSDFLDKTATGQEDLLLAFTELITAPGGRHIFAFSLASFIDVIVFLLAFSAGPHVSGSPEQRWWRAGAALDDQHDQIFVRNLLRKVEPEPRGMPRVPINSLSAGEQQFCLVLAAKGRATIQEGYYLLDEDTHEQLMDSMATRQFPLRAAPKPATANGDA